MSVLQLQQRVLGPSAPVDYSTIVMQSYPAYAIQKEPFIGFKVKLRDTQVNQYYGGENRMRMIDQYLQQSRLLVNTGCILRATAYEMPDGIWVITMPVPRSQIVDALNNLFHVMQFLEVQLGIVLTGEDFEINVSGRCTPLETEQVLGGLHIPQQYLQYLRPPINTPYKVGHPIRINDIYLCFRTRWNFGLKPVQELYEVVMTLSQVISAMYH